MKTHLSGLLLLLFMFSGFVTLAQTETAIEIVKKSDEKFRGKTSRGKMSMKIIRPSWSRTITMKNWSKGDDYSMVLILSPAKEKGQVFLSREKDLWNWTPSIGRMIKMPPSVMSQGWMGSDVSNDDVMRQSSLVEDYEHTIVSTEVVSGESCHKIQFIPKAESDVVWSKIMMWISKDDYLRLKAEYYDEDGFLVHTETASDIKMLGGRMIPSKMDYVPADEEGNKTVFIIESIEFDVDIPDSFFSQQNMKRVK